MDYDVIVLGVGGMGSAALYQLASRGLHVLGLEQYDIPHALGSSHGVNRIIRLAYWEDPAYVPMLRRAYELWRQIEAKAHEPLLVITGSVDAGPKDSPTVLGSLRSCAVHNLPHERLNGSELRGRFPGYRVPSDYVAIYQAEGGFVLSERAIVAHVMTAQRQGAEVHGRERVLSFEPIGDGVQVQTEHGSYTADRLVVTAGAFTGELLPQLRELAVPERQVLIWTQPKRPELFETETFPVFNLETDTGDRYYGFPVYGVPGFKFGKYHHLRQSSGAHAVDRVLHQEDEDVLRAGIRRFFPEADGPTMALTTCMFTNTKDEHFIVDRLPGFEAVSIAAGFSGHGYKFCSVMGEILADLAMDRRPAFDLRLFRLNRF